MLPFLLACAAGLAASDDAGKDANASTWTELDCGYQDGQWQAELDEPAILSIWVHRSSGTAESYQLLPDVEGEVFLQDGRLFISAGPTLNIDDCRIFVAQ